ncbi:MAG TPA: zf-HC2 domain-containing protein, partial [Symbiobacteriaceae bacterium]|nr:zf-HC2 domain-containing protein [Symbiobacteriaceae bacterium]
MTCTFDRELLALYAGGDAEADECQAVEAHLGGCTECAVILDQYRTLAGALATAERPQALRRPRRRPVWVPVAAAAVVVLLAVTLFQGPVLAAFLRWFQVKELTPAETLEIAGRTPEVEWVPELMDSVAPGGAEELEKRYGLPVAHADVGPDWEWISVTIPRKAPPAYISYHWTPKNGGGSLYLRQERTPWERTHLVAEGMSQQVTVHGEQAWIIHGAFVDVSEAHPTG